MKHFLTLFLFLIISCKSTEKISTPDFKEEVKSKMELQLKSEKDCSKQNKILMNAYLNKSEEYTKLWLDYSQLKNENAFLKKELELRAELEDKLQPKKTKIKKSNNEKTKLENSVQIKDIDSGATATVINPNLGDSKEKTVKKSPFVAWVMVSVSLFFSGLIVGFVLAVYRKSIPLLKLLPF